MRLALFASTSLVALLASGGSGGGDWSPVGKTGVVAAWDMETVYQEAALSTAANDTDPVGGVPDLTGNGNILSVTGSARPVRASSGGLFYADFDGVDDYFDVTFPVGQRTSDMTLMFAIDMDPAEVDFILFSSRDGSNNPYVGLGIDAATAVGQTGSGTPTYHLNDDAALSPANRDTIRDAVTSAGIAVIEVRNFDVTGSSWVSFATLPTFFRYRASQFLSNHNLYRGILLDNNTISAEDIASARQWVADGAGVTL